jgi:hypothetical protein
MALVAVVTPADENSPTVEAFQQEGDGFGWGDDIDVYSATEYANGVQGAAKDAYDNLDRGGVLVAAGEMTATILQGMTTTAPIIMAFGGRDPVNTDTTNKNMTGFVGDCTTIARKHLRQLKNIYKYKGSDITVLYDYGADQGTNDVTQYICGVLKGDDQTINTKSIDVTDIGGKIAALLTTPGLMMVPNAVFFEQAAVIAHAVDNSDVVIAYYPEFYYYTKHRNKNKAKVVGFNVPATYRVAASWVNRILLELDTTQTIISALNSKQFAEAIEDPYLVPEHQSASTLKKSLYRPKQSPSRRAATKNSTKPKS